MECESVQECYLDISNTFPLGEGTLGKVIARTGHECLWEPRHSRIDTVVIHYISAAGKEVDDPFRLDFILPIFPEYGVSSHYLIQRDGSVYALVPEGQKAWHCGAGVMPAPDPRRGINDFSLGVELVATDGSGFTGAQYRSLSSLCRRFELTYSAALNFVGHSDVAGARAVALGLRAIPKPDPGPLFDWDRFHRLRIT